MSAAHKALVLRFITDVWSEGDLAAIDDAVADHYTIHHDPGDPWDGQCLSREGLRERVRLSRAPFPDQHFTVVHAAAEAGEVMVAWTWAATHRGDIPGFPATGKAIYMSGMTTYFVEDGSDGTRITGHWQVADRMTVGQQLMANRA